MTSDNVYNVLTVTVGSKEMLNIVHLKYNPNQANAAITDNPS